MCTCHSIFALNVTLNTDRSKIVQSLKEIIESKQRKGRMNSLNEEQKTMIILKYCEVRNLIKVRRYPKHPRKVPQLVVFKRVIDRFYETGSCRKERPPGRTKVGEKNVAAVRIFLNKMKDQPFNVPVFLLRNRVVHSQKKIVSEGVQITTG